mgnify:CR=1 FL=1
MDQIKAFPLLAVKHTLLQLGNCTGEIESRVVFIKEEHMDLKLGSLSNVSTVDFPIVV